MTPTPSSIDGLIERLEAATEGTPALDLAVFTAFESTEWERGPVEHYSRSVDAALALVERVLPGSDMRMESDDDTWSFAVGRVGDSAWSAEAVHATAPLAILLALLRSIKSESTKP